MMVQALVTYKHLRYTDEKKIMTIKPMTVWLLLLVFLFDATTAAEAAVATAESFQPNWETGLSRLPQVVEQRMLRIQAQLFDMIHKRDLDRLHHVFTLIEDALLPIHLPALKTPVEEHLAALHEHYVEQSGTAPVARISPQEITQLKQKFRSYSFFWRQKKNQNFLAPKKKSFFFSGSSPRMHVQKTWRLSPLLALSVNSLFETHRSRSITTNTSSCSHAS
jgi:hypothetical protein